MVVESFHEVLVLQFQSQYVSPYKVFFNLTKVPNKGHLSNHVKKILVSITFFNFRVYI